MKNIVIIGAGTMGLDIAQAFAKAGFDVFVRDIKEEIIDIAKERLASSLSKASKKGKISEEEKDFILSHISFTTDIGIAKDSDLVIEAIVENLDVKKQVFKELDQICNKDTIFASNTSSISITAIAAATNRPDRFVGMHFFNPATIKKLVEIIRGQETSDEAFKTIYDLTLAIDKEPITVIESPGFVLNRILIPMINEAINVLDSGIASAEDIDKAMQLGANHKMGPLHLGDLIGLDVCLSIMETIHSETNNSKYAPAPLLRKMVRGGRLGKKAGIGFFDYK